MSGAAQTRVLRLRPGGGHGLDFESGGGQKLTFESGGGHGLDFESGGGHGLNSEICARLFQNLRKTQTLLFAKNIMTLLVFLQHGISAMILPAVTSHANFPADMQGSPGGHAQPRHAQMCGVRVQAWPSLAGHMQGFSCSMESVP